MNSKNLVPKETVFYRTNDPQATSMFSRSTHGMTHQHNYPAAPAESRNQALEPYPSVPVSYPESSQRTRMHHDQFQFHEVSHESTTQKRGMSYTVTSASVPFSLPPAPSDRPPPSLRLPSPPSFSGPTFPPSDSYSATQSSSWAGAVNYRRLSLSLTDSDDDVGYIPPHRQDFIPIVPKSTETSTSFPAGSELDLSYDRTSGLSTPNSASELSASPPISIQTIPSSVEPRDGRRRKGPEKMVILKEHKNRVIQPDST
ncbi:hypothetical protein DFH08DRAFT_414055 [Mycena albidolilacea]|uniref:Uncharacterized protein n=1 Tax=Mycena albidolilacea TaxID=1033008 RepID=A0AAD7AIC7_9AGAR|nr:hypothetical protein DFH08DRAFT_414055 [Mycena albidolilacea]